jgi:hypothetical protein
MKITRFLTNTIGTAMLAGALLLAPQAAQARVFLSVAIAPPAIPIYAQPICPGDGYIWTPGYWQYTDDGYEWVDGAWVLAPYTGALWTPGYWAYAPGGYFWNAGYWGPVVGYYGGINYGFGYFGVGFYGGYWNGGHFFYNREYNHFGREGGFRNVYDRRVEGFDGRPGGTSFAHAASNQNRGGTFNHAANFNPGASQGNRNFTAEAGRSAFQNDSPGSGVRIGQPSRIASGSDMRGFVSGRAEANGANELAQNRSSFQQPGYNQARGGISFNGSYSGSNIRQAAPASSFHPSQGSNFSGAQHSAPAPSFQSGGGFHSAGGGGGSHGGRR